MTAVCDSATQVLRENSLPLLRTLDVSEDDNEVVLRGRVNTYFEKQLAQEAVLPVLRRRRLRNLLVVARI